MKHANLALKMILFTKEILKMKNRIRWSTHKSLYSQGQVKKYYQIKMNLVNRILLFYQITQK